VMADKPIIFSAPMVCALLDGRKTQTRRVIKNVPDAPPARCAPRNAPKHPAPYLDAYCGERPTSTNPRGMGRNWHWWQIDDRPGPVAFRLPYATGDRLWVREAFTTCEKHKFMIAYRADGECGAWCWDGDGKPIFIHHGHVLEASPRGQWGFARYGGRWRSPIHMPRWASRLTLTVTDVRVQRLQEISEADAWAEGCRRGDATDNGGYFPADETDPSGIGWRGWDCACDWYADLWNSLHGPEAWDANPWVAAYSFTVQRGNIDAAKETAND